MIKKTWTELKGGTKLWRVLDIKWITDYIIWCMAKPKYLNCMRLSARRVENSHQDIIISKVFLQITNMKMQVMWDDIIYTSYELHGIYNHWEIFKANIKYRGSELLNLWANEFTSQMASNVESAPMASRRVILPRQHPITCIRDCVCGNRFFMPVHRIYPCANNKIRQYIFEWADAINCESLNTFEQAEQLKMGEY